MFLLLGAICVYITLAAIFLYTFKYWHISEIFLLNFAKLVLFWYSTLLWLPSIDMKRKELNSVNEN